MANLSRIDLNLFVLFDAIYAEGSVTRASERLHLTQPAVSHALARLRSTLDDPLFIREGNKLIPSPLARELIGPIRKALKEIENSLNQMNLFDPAQCSKTFTIGMRHIVEAYTAPMLIARMRETAPDVKLGVMQHDRSSLAAALGNGTLDAALDVFLHHSNEVSVQQLTGGKYVVAARRGHPSILGELSLEQYLDLEHVVASSRLEGASMEDEELSRQGLDRKIAVRCQHYSTACQIAAATDMIVTLPERFAEIANNGLNNQIVPFPLDVMTPDMYLYWHVSAQDDPTNRWFRDQIAACFFDGVASTNSATSSES